MQLKSFNHKVTQDFVYATFIGNITKLLPIESFKLSFERLGGIYCPEESGVHGSVWKFPVFISSQVIEEIIHNTCFVCGGLMKDGQALENTWVGSEDFGGDYGQRGTTISKIGQPVMKLVRKCSSCGHSHT